VPIQRRLHTPAVAGSRPASGPSGSSLSDSLLITSGAARRGRRHPCRPREFESRHTDGHTRKAGLMR